jgi:hypothetical protein
MKLIEFLSLGIKAGDKIRVTYDNHIKSKPEHADVFFKGFRIWSGSRVERNPDRLIPVFNKTTKDGKRSRNEYDGYFGLEEIIDIEFLNEKTNLVKYLNERNDYFDVPALPSIANIFENLESRARQQLFQLVKELDDLFPDLQVALNEYEKAWRDDGYNNISYPTHVVSVGYWKGHGKSLDNICLNIVSKHDNGLYELDKDIYVEDCYRLLSNTISSIINPEEIDKEDIEEHDVIDFHSMAWEDIPTAQREKHPYLFNTKILERLRVEKWWKTLTDDQIKTIFPEVYNIIIKHKYADRPEKDYASHVRMEWESISFDEKQFIFTHNIKK